MSEDEQATERLRTYEVTEEQRERADELASGTGSGSVVVKPQLCGKYCAGCPHGPYAWLVNDDGWTYLGRVGDASDSDSRSESYQSQDESPVVDPPAHVDEELVQMTTAFDEVVEQDESSEHWMVEGRITDTSKIEGDNPIHVRVAEKAGRHLVQIYDEETERGVTKQDPTGISVMSRALSDVGNGEATISETSLNTAKVRYGTEELTFISDDNDGAKINPDWGGDSPGVVSDVDELDTYLSAASNYDAYGNGSEIAALAEKETNYGPKIGIESPYEAKDDIDDLDWDTYNQKWDQNLDMWFIDADVFDGAVDELENAGWNVETGSFS